MSDALAQFIGACWRAVPIGREAQVLGGTVAAGRYNRPGQRTLYMSSSPAAVTAAMARYGDAPRAVVRLDVVADRLLDLRDAGGCARLRIDPAQVKDDWMATLARGEEPASWTVADDARAVDVAGLIDASRRVPDLWHMVLFRWNDGSGVRVSVAGRHGGKPVTSKLGFTEPGRPCRSPPDVAGCPAAARTAAAYFCD